MELSCWLMLRAEDSSVPILVVEAVLPDGFVGVGNRRRNHIPAARPLAQIDQAAAVAAKREVGVRRLYRLLADRATEFDQTLARHRRIAEFRGQIVEGRAFLPWVILTSAISPLTSDLKRFPPPNRNRAPP